MKKTFLFLSVMLLGLLTFVSCSDDDNKNDPSSVVGTWKYSSDAGTMFYRFFSNGDFVMVNIAPTTDEGNSVVGGSYTVSGANLTLVAGGQSKSATFIRNGNTLKINSDGTTLTFDRVSDSDIASYISEFKTVNRSLLLGVWKSVDDESTNYVYFKDDGTCVSIDIQGDEVNMERGTWTLYKNILATIMGEDSETDLTCMFITSLTSTSLTTSVAGVSGTSTRVPYSEIARYLEAQ